MQFVFCISFLCSLIPLEKSSLECFKFVVMFSEHFKYTRGQRGQRPNLSFFFYFESDIPKIFPSHIPAVEIK